MLFETVIFIASVCGQPEVQSCDVHVVNDNHYKMVVTTTNVVMKRNDFMSTGGTQTKIEVEFQEAK